MGPGQPGKGRHAWPGAAAGCADAVHSHWIPDVLEALVAEEFVAGGDDAPDLLEDGAGKADATGLCDLFEASRNTHGRASGASLLQDQFTRIKADTEDDLLVDGESGVTLAGFRLNAKGAFQCLDRAGEFGHEAVSRKAEHAAVRLLDLAAKPVELSSDASVGFLLVALHQSAVAQDVGAEDRSQSALESSSTGAWAGRG
jgi:hypothetical protein